VFLESLYDLRNRLLSSERFRRVAQKLPIFQSIARKRSIDLFRLCSGFVHSQVLLACVRLGLFDLLAEGARPLSDIARDAGVDSDRLQRLLDAAVGLELLERLTGDRYGLGVHGAAMAGNASLLALVEHHALFYEDLTDPVSLFANPDAETAMAKLWPYATGDHPESLGSDDVARYTELMAASQAMIAEQVLGAVSLRRHRKLLDIGGGAGAFAIAVAQRWPHLEIAIADIPAVADIARERVVEAGMASRIEVIGIDATRDTLPDGFDVVSLVRILHDHDNDVAMSFLKGARNAIADGGTLLVAEPMADAPGAGGLIATYFHVYLLAMGSGRPRGFDELSRLLEDAGFRGVRRLRTTVPLITSVIAATG
jgi:demethylspheroidene O-methyltransferase